MIGAMIQADDFNREMTLVETLIAFMPIIPISWFVLILVARGLNSHPEKNKSYIKCIKIVISFFAIMFFISLFVL